MNDLQTLRAVLTPGEVPQDVVDRSRHRLQNRMLTGPRRRVARPLALGAGLVAAAAAAAVVVATLPGTAPAPAPQPQAAAPVVTGTQVLLAAATVAEHAPEGTGKYWYIRTASGNQVVESWTTSDGHRWARGPKAGGPVTRLGVLVPLQLATTDVTFEQLRTLPTDPAALRDWLVNAIAHSSAGPFTAPDRERKLLLSMVSLVSTLPAPPAVRAAAFRSIAAYPGVQDLGPVPGGRGFLLSGHYRLVVDPSTGRINRTSMYVTAEGAIRLSGNPEGAEVSSGWTDSLPK